MNVLVSHYFKSLNCKETGGRGREKKRKKKHLSKHLVLLEAQTACWALGQSHKGIHTRSCFGDMQLIIPRGLQCLKALENVDLCALLFPSCAETATHWIVVSICTKQHCVMLIYSIFTYVSPSFGVLLSSERDNIIQTGQRVTHDCDEDSLLLSF